MSAITAPPQRAARRGHRRTRSRWNRSAFGRSAAQLLPWPTVTPLATAMVVLLLTTTLLLRSHPGDSPVLVHLTGPDKETVLRLGDEFRCDARNGLFADLRILFGADCIG